MALSAVNRGTNFRSEDDRKLARAWIATSAIQLESNAVMFWERVTESFNNLATEDCPNHRTVDSLRRDGLL
jgi:hypothetical protein